MVANTDYSPRLDDSFNFDKPYLADSYTARPDYTFDTLFDNDSFFDHPVSSVEYRNPQCFNETQPASTYSNSWSPVDPAPFGRLGDLNTAFATTTKPAFAAINPCSYDAEQMHSRTPSLCGDAPQPTLSISPPLSPQLKRESSSDIDFPSSPKRQAEPLVTASQPPRKRGRPRLDRSSTSSSFAPTPARTFSSSSQPSSSSCKVKPTQRLPHNQVERKYREGLNSELERLRRAVPTLIQRDTRDLTSPPKPSKATILASAIEYIKTTERERDMLRLEVERLRGANGRRNRME
ncbi:hypothetical protein P154DRAFT_437801 [Amniculicola lignicola CBS 123094]|uniref:BHLH domain-containing protein n=1 Tax=Amniculicola lignicola CBS 123094 TaxID=1392246 RepID=A0A6A5WBW1_9PLEO|nr:hypothetical protein P154DRAFT_437801 [Amniculicola lignicola CBS 123094]